MLFSLWSDGGKTTAANGGSVEESIPQTRLVEQFEGVESTREERQQDGDVVGHDTATEESDEATVADKEEHTGKGARGNG